MKFETKFNIGDIIWVARSYPENHRESVVINGKTYWASDEDATYTFKPVAKSKVITEIEVAITKQGIEETYWGHDSTREDALDGIIFSTRNNNQIFSSWEEALSFAKMKAENGEAYYG